MEFSVRDLSYFLAVADSGSIVTAASVCHVTQPAISKAIRRVEDTLELTLFARSKSGMALTASGEMFREHALKIRGEHEDAMRHAQALRSGSAGLLRIGATRAAYDHVVGPALATMLRESPKLMVRLELDAADELIELLQQGMLDLLVVPLTGPTRADLVHTHLCPDELCVLAADRHPARALMEPSLRELSKFQWILPKPGTGVANWFNAQFHTAGLEPPVPAVEVDYGGPATLGIVARSELLLFTPLHAGRHVVLPGVSPLVVPALETRRRLYAIQRRDDYRSPVMARMRELLAPAASVT